MRITVGCCRMARNRGNTLLHHCLVAYSKCVIVLVATMKQQPNLPILLSGRANPAFARKLAKKLNLPLGNVDIATFADKETHVVVQEDCAGRDVYIVQSLSMPANEHVMELLLIMHAVSSLRPRRITAVVPFMAYRRQEKTTQRGEVLAFQLIAQLLYKTGCRRIVTMDLHKHRSSRFFKEVGIVNRELRAFDVLVDHLQAQDLRETVLVAPDKGSIPESERYAKALRIPLIKVYKRRARRDHVTIDHIEGNVAGKKMLLIDDEINTAGTLMSVINLLAKKQQSSHASIVCTHGVFSGEAIQRLTHPAIRQIILTDTIALPTKKRLPTMTVVSVAPLFAQVLQRWMKLPL